MNLAMNFLLEKNRASHTAGQASRSNAGGVSLRGSAAGQVSRSNAGGVSMRLAISLILVLSGFSLSAQQPCPPARPPLSEGLVHQYGDAQMLTAQEESALESKLISQDDSTSVQIVIVVHPDLCGMPAAQFGARLGEEWGVGQQGKDNGIVIAIKPRKGSTSGDLSIQVGRGALVYVDAAMAGRVIDRVIIPAFKEGRYYEGLDRGTDAIMQMVAGQYDPEADQDSPIPILIVALIMVIILFLFFYIASKAEHMTTYTGGGWTNHRGGLGGWGGGIGRGGFGGGGGGFSGGGGGGFGGFGGGSFGGGGASGGW